MHGCTLTNKLKRRAAERNNNFPRMAEVLHFDHSSETSHTTVPFSTYSIIFMVVEWKDVCVCVGYEAVMAALRLSLCSAGSAVTAAWKSALWFWANFCISAAEMFWLSLSTSLLPRT